MRLGERDDETLTQTRAEVAVMGDISRRSGRPVSYGLVQSNPTIKQSAATSEGQIIGHVDEARHDLNFSEWGKYRLEDQKAQLGQMCELITEGWMPLSSYTPLHPSAKLSDEDKKVICDWASAARARLR